METKITIKLSIKENKMIKLIDKLNTNNMQYTANYVKNVNSCCTLKIMLLQPYDVNDLVMLGFNIAKILKSIR